MDAVTFRFMMAAGAPVALSGSILTAADIYNDGSLIGFSDGYIEDAGGSLSPNPVGGFLVHKLADASGVYLTIYAGGDQVSALASRTLTINGAPRPFSGASVLAYNPEDDYTYALFLPVYGFVDGLSYTVDIV